MTTLNSGQAQSSLAILVDLRDQPAGAKFPVQMAFSDHLIQIVGHKPATDANEELGVILKPIRVKARFHPVLNSNQGDAVDAGDWTIGTEHGVDFGLDVREDPT